MKIYHYHPITKEYLGEGLADKDPLEKDSWLIPAHATNTQPPKTPESEYTIAFIDNEWKYIEIEQVARVDVVNSSPSTETAFAKVSKMLESINYELINMNAKLNEKDEKINKLEEDLLSIKQKNAINFEVK
jgi:hypothetical protein